MTTAIVLMALSLFSLTAGVIYYPSCPKFGLLNLIGWIFLALASVLIIAIEIENERKK